MNQKVLKSIKKYLYDIDSTLEIVRNDFEKNNINLDKFLGAIETYIQNFSKLENNKNDALVELLSIKLYEIITKYQYLDNQSYVTQIKSNINFIEKHKKTFFGDISTEKDLPYVVSDSSGLLQTISVENFYSIKDISLSNLENKKEIYIVGENGDGKTLLLQAIAISLVGISQGKVFDLVKKESYFSFLAKNTDGVIFQSNTIQGMIYTQIFYSGFSL